nr:50S ribosomal protein L23 [Schlegelella koreensis]
MTPEERAARKASKKANKAAAVAARRPAHSESRLAQVLVAPIISEKATMAAEKHNQVLFQVMRDATKPEIKAAVELMFKVSVDSVQTVQHKGKVKRTAKSNGRRDHVKKAYVCLAAGEELNFSGEGA